MQIGDLVVDHSEKSRLAIIISKDFFTSIGTPFDWAVYYFDTQVVFGADSRNLEVIC